MQVKPGALGDHSSDRPALGPIYFKSSRVSTGCTCSPFPLHMQAHNYMVTMHFGFAQLSSPTSVGNASLHVEMPCLLQSFYV